MYTEMNSAFAHHFDGIAPLSLRRDFTATGANLKSVAQNLSYTGPADLATLDA